MLSEILGERGWNTYMTGKWHLCPTDEMHLASTRRNHHAIDIVRTILDCLSVQPPEAIKGHVQSSFDGISMRYSFNDGGAPGRRRTQSYSMLGSRAIWHDGWKAISTHPTISRWSHFNGDTWEVYNVDADPAEFHDLSAQGPGAREPVIRRGRTARSRSTTARPSKFSTRRGRS